ncbi:MAG: hypothetical protein ACTH8X_01185 [Corynebacterium variabile]|uniref:hypothetical protein n=1 Tax=Corynebacterium variabile TaxID=1727 RepID=UPI003FB67CCF
MRLPIRSSAAAATVATVLVLGACSSDDDDDNGNTTDDASTTAYATADVTNAEGDALGTGPASARTVSPPTPPN